MDDLLVTAPRVLAPDGALAPGWVALTADRITGVGTGAGPRAAARRDVDGTVVPGFVDLHAHGGGGGGFDQAADDAGAVARAVAEHRRHGSTSMLASLVSAPPAALLRQVAALAEHADDGLVDGIHLEGPWLSPARAGAHDRAALRPPDAGELGGAVRLAGLALRDAVAAATGTPAAVLGLPDRGVLAPGARADLVVLDDELRAVAVLRAGRWVGD